MSNLEECCRFGVLIPSGTSFGVDDKRSKPSDLVPALGGARSPGMVSADPGGGICFRDSYQQEEEDKDGEFKEYLTRCASRKIDAYRCAGAYYHARC